jgi:hypothetical protein
MGGETFWAILSPKYPVALFDIENGSKERNGKMASTG